MCRPRARVFPAAGQGIFGRMNYLGPEATFFGQIDCEFDTFSDGARMGTVILDSFVKTLLQTTLSILDKKQLRCSASKNVSTSRDLSALARVLAFWLNLSRAPKTVTERPKGTLYDLIILACRKETRSYQSLS